MADLVYGLTARADVHGNKKPDYGLAQELCREHIQRCKTFVAFCTEPPPPAAIRSDPSVYPDCPLR